MPALTPSLDQHPARLRVYWRQHRTFPAIAELTAVLGMASTNGVHKALGRLVEEGTLAQLKGRSDWMTYRQIAEALLARRQLSLEVARMSKFVQKVREALFFQMKAGAVEREMAISFGVHDQKQRFRLSRTIFRP